MSYVPTWPVPVTQPQRKHAGDIIDGNPGFIEGWGGITPAIEVERGI